MKSMAAPRPAGRAMVAALIGAALLVPASPVLAPFLHPSATAGPGHAVAPPPSTWALAQLQVAQRSLHGFGLAVDHSPSRLVSVASTGTQFGWDNLTTVASPGPSARYAASLAWDGADGYVLLYGGIRAVGSTTTILSDTWSYLNGTWRDLTGTVSGSPPPLAAASMVYSPTDHEVVMFGGEHTNASGADLGTTWVYHAGVWTNLTGSLSSAPSPRIDAGICFDSTDGNVVLYGGQNNTGQQLQDTWTFHGGGWTNITSTAPTGARLYLPRVADDPSDHGVLMAGIDSFNPAYGPPYRPATFLLTGGAWHNLTPTLVQEPPMVFLGGLASLGPSAGIIMFTGALVDGSGIFERGSVVWQYLGGAWTNITSTLTTAPGSLAFPGYAVTPEGAMVVFGGLMVVGGGSLTNATPYTWVFSSVPTVGVTTSRSTIDAGQSVTASSGVAGGVDPISLTWSFGDGGTGTAPVVTHSYAASGLFLVTVRVTDLVGHFGFGSAAVQVNPDPTVSIVVAPSSVHSGSGATFVAVVTGGTAPFTYVWTLGDGSTAATATVNHTYSNTGTVSVTVQVTDAAGQLVSATTSVSVGSPMTAVNLTSGTGLGLLIGVIVLAIAAVAFALMWMRARNPRPPRSPPPSASGGP